MSRQMYWDEEAHQFFPVDDVPQEPVKPTNADRFRAMSDEELAIQLVSEQIMACAALLKGLDDKDLLFAYVEEAKNMKSEMIKEKLDWLKKEVKEECDLSKYV